MVNFIYEYDNDITTFNKDVDILSNLPDVISVIKEIEAIANVENPILKAEWDLINIYISNQFVLTSDIPGISRYEKMFNIKVSVNDDLETRIIRVLTKIQEKAPYTFLTLKNYLSNTLAIDDYEISRNVATKNLIIELGLKYSNLRTVILEYLEKTLPVNMTYQVDIKYNRHQQLRDYAHIDLSTRNHLQLREEEL